MERYLKISIINLKITFLPHILVILFMCFIAPFIMGVQNLQPDQVAKIVESYLSLFGIILFLPVFIPDMNNNIRDLIASKKESMITHHCIRVMEALILLFLVGMLFLFYLKSGDCRFLIEKMSYSLIANSIFLGGMGMLVFAISNQVAFAYMIPITYYIICYGSGKKYLGNFYLFTMQYGSFQEKYYIFVLGLIMITTAIIVRDVKFNLRKYK
ncbi:hypothetical protein [Anaerosacchariphilus polymeriproducens]|uniref:ABC transporter permease n=1 Tax=Anaerosacchariphilus polymeriproducens TaxID=1812858 RepID=A0A371AZG9_9FIRM|nr:hypothetical protein [Anaerosacchariphilus polymeriproducens]RDU24870.1 hypothetical protein DWV06_02530 [Anaerosacchariphilus polymeriproducens]